jgi:hypothetical protein
VTPALGLQYAHINVPGFTEQGAARFDGSGGEHGFAARAGGGAGDLRLCK